MSYWVYLPETFANIKTHQKIINNHFPFRQKFNLLTDDSCFFPYRFIMMAALGLALIMLSLSGPTLAFVPIGGGASTHVSITGTALLQKVTETCRALVEAAGQEFKLTVGSKKHSYTTCRNINSCLPSFQHIFVILISLKKQTTKTQRTILDTLFR